MTDSALPRNPGQDASRPLLGIQYLRGIAAVMVAYYHTLDQLPAYQPYLRDFVFGEAHLANGVDLFFVISGFIMLVSSRMSRPLNFAIRRIARIVPLYWTLTLLLAGLALLRPELFRTTTLDFEYLLKSLLFLPYGNPSQQGEFVPLLVPGWSLNLEMFFYAIFALVLFVPFKARVLLTTLFFLLIFAGGWLVHATGHDGLIAFYASIRLFEFAFGTAIGHWFVRGGLPRSPLVCGLLIGAGFYLLLAGAPLTGMTAGSAGQVLLDNVLPAVLVVLGTVALENSGRIASIPSLTLLGDASYSMYLSHVFTLGVARVAWSRIVTAPPSQALALTFGAFALALAIAASLAVYRLLEQPLQALFHRRRRVGAVGAAALSTGSPQ